MDQDPTPETLDPLSGTALFTTPTSLCPSLPALLSLSSNGQYTSLLSLISQSRSSQTTLSKPHDHITFLTLNALSLFKLKNYTSSLQELQSLIPFDSSKYRYETYPDIYPNLSGSMIPFAVRILYALLPEKLGDRKETLDRLYLLLDYVRSKKEPVVMWERREAYLLSLICDVHFSHKEFDVCFQLVNEILKLDVCRDDAMLVSKLGYIQLQIGDLDGAKETFKKVGNMECEDGNLVGRNRALVCLVERDYVGAVREYEECIERDGGDVVAVNNKALCLMYLRDLSDSIKLLEGALERVPNVAVNETVVVNLCSMYELAYVSHGEVKKSLSNWIARVAPDDFDSSCTRI